MTPRLLEPLTLRGTTARNRAWLAPMCQYSSTDGLVDDWHVVHLGARAVGGFGLVLTEATAVVPEGRITPHDAGLWADAHVEPWAWHVTLELDTTKWPGAASGRHASRPGGRAMRPR